MAECTIKDCQYFHKEGKIKEKACRDCPVKPLTMDKTKIEISNEFYDGTINILREYVPKGIITTSDIIDVVNLAVKHFENDNPKED